MSKEVRVCRDFWVRVSLWFRYNFTMIDLDEHKQDERKVRRYFTGVISTVVLLCCCVAVFSRFDRRTDDIIRAFLQTPQSFFCDERIPDGVSTSPHLKPSNDIDLPCDLLACLRAS